MREKILTSMTTPSMPGDTLRDESFTSFAFSPKMAVSSFSSGDSSVSPFGVILPTRMSPGFTCAPMRTMPRSSRSTSVSSDDVRDFARDFFLAALGVADVQFEFLDVDRRVHVVLHQALAESTMASSKLWPYHGMNATVTFAPSASCPISVAAPSASTSPALHLLAHADERTLVDRRVLVGAPVLLELVAIELAEPRQRT